MPAEFSVVIEKHARYVLKQVPKPSIGTIDCLLDHIKKKVDYEANDFSTT